MVVIFAFLIILLLASLKYHKKGIDAQYLSKEYTQPIKGIFVIIVFLSHVRTYTEFNHSSDLFVINVLNYLGQLMVALFLFYSGYGIYEAIKKRGNVYIDSLIKNRLGKTYFDFALSIILFLILDMSIGKFYSASQIVLSFIGWSSIGNSAWYMFAIFTLYLLTFVCFKFSKDNRITAIILLTVCSLGYIYILSLIKPNYWSSTYLCYVAGMWYSFFKEKIDHILKNKVILYYLVTICSLVIYMYFYRIRNQRLLMFNLVAILFCLVFVLGSMKISFHSKILTWLGNHLFWIYILQRIPMILLKHCGVAAQYPYIFLFVTFIVTLLMAYYMNIISNQLKKLVWN